MLTNRQIDNRVVKYKSLQEEIEKLKAQAEKLQDELKQEMLNKGVEKLETSNHSVKWTSCTRDSFDAKSFQQDYPEMYKDYMKKVDYRRFSIKY